MRIAETEISFQYPNEETVMEVRNDKVYEKQPLLVHESNKSHPEIEIIHTEENKQTNSVIHTLASNVKTTKRSVAAQRLLKSSNATTVLADVSSKELLLKEKYNEKKLGLMERIVFLLSKLFWHSVKN